MESKLKHLAAILVALIFLVAAVGFNQFIWNGVIADVTGFREISTWEAFCIAMFFSINTYPSKSK